MSACIEGRLDLVQYFFEWISPDEKVRSSLPTIYTTVKLSKAHYIRFFSSISRLHTSMLDLAIRGALSSTSSL